MKAEAFLIQPGSRWYATQSKGAKEKEIASCLADLQVETFLPWLRHRVESKFHRGSCAVVSRLFLLSDGPFRLGQNGALLRRRKNFLKFGDGIAAVGDRIY